MGYGLCLLPQLDMFILRITTEAGAYFASLIGSRKILKTTTTTTPTTTTTKTTVTITTTTTTPTTPTTTTTTTTKTTTTTPTTTTTTTANLVALYPNHEQLPHDICLIRAGHSDKRRS